VALQRDKADAILAAMKPMALTLSFDFQEGGRRDAQPEIIDDL
jgi:hypothetical protein